MNYLIDTNIFINEIPRDVTTVAMHSKSILKPMMISEAILSELGDADGDPNVDNHVYYVVRRMTTEVDPPLIKLCKISDVPKAQAIYNDIRDRYYGWMKDGNYLQKMITDGKITREELHSHSFRKKDVGECELVALAAVSNGEDIVVTNDLGRVYKHPNINIFDFAETLGVVVKNGTDWLSDIECIDNVHR